MLLDANWVFSDNQDISADSGTVTSTNIVDLQVADPDVGSGSPLWIIILAQSTFAGASMNVTPAVEESDDNSTWLLYTRTKNYTVGELTQGTLMMGMTLQTTTKRYLRVRYYNGGSSGWTTANVDAFLTTAEMNSTLAALP